MSTENQGQPLISKRKEGDATCAALADKLREENAPSIPAASNAAPTFNPSGAAPLPRPLEQEQWTKEKAIEIWNGPGNQFENLCDAHNTSLRALQEEHDCDIAVIIGPLRCKLDNALAACKAKDEALQICIDAFKRLTFTTCDEFPAQLEAEKALALQPDSSVKLEEKDRELRWGEGEEFRKLAEKERNESRACLKLMLSVNGGFRLTAEEFERCQKAAGITGANKAGTMQKTEVPYEGDCVP